MTKLLWLITVALGHRMWLEQSFHLQYHRMLWVHRILRWISVGWVVAFLWTAVWWVVHYQ